MNRWYEAAVDGWKWIYGVRVLHNHRSAAWAKLLANSLRKISWRYSWDEKSLCLLDIRSKMMLPSCFWRSSKNTTKRLKINITILNEKFEKFWLSFYCIKYKNAFETTSSRQKPHVRRCAAKTESSAVKTFENGTCSVEKRIIAIKTLVILNKNTNDTFSTKTQRHHDVCQKEMATRRWYFMKKRV